MTDQAHRAAELDRLLRRALDVSPDAKAGPCPDADVLTAYVEGGLDASERTAFEAHAYGCHRCLESLAALAQLESLPASEVTAPVRSWWRTLWPWVAPMTAAAAAALVYVAVRPAPTQLGAPALPDVEMAQPAVQERSAAPETAADQGQTTKDQVAGEGLGADSIGQTTESHPQSSRASQPASQRPAKAEPREEGEARQFAPSPEPPQPARAAVPASPPAAAPGPPASGAERLVANAVPPPQAAPPHASRDQAAGQAAPGVAEEVSAPPLARGAGTATAATAVTGAARPAEPQARPQKTEAAGGRAPAAPAPVAQSEALASRERSEADTAASSTKSVGFAGAVATPRWRVGVSGRIERSDDGGLVWRPQASGVSADLVAFQVVNATTVWVVGARGTVLVTTDGEAWQRVNTPTDGDLVRVAARDANTAVVAARDGSQYSTSDRGRTWTNVR